MKEIISFYLLLVVVSCISAQSKQDYYWPLGIDNLVDEEFGAIELDFNVKPFLPRVREAGLEFDQNNASICDKDGNLLFYSNGCAVANRLHEVMPNGDHINAGIYFDLVWGGDCESGYPGRQNVMILPDRHNENGYYLLQVPTTVDTVALEVNIDKLLYTYIDMNLDGGLGDVIEKDVEFHDGDVLSSYLTAISHENEKDWWIINPVFPSGYLVYLLDDEGFHLSSIEEGPVWDDKFSSSAGDARFSPDGTKYAYFNRTDGLYLYDFDRGMGRLSMERHMSWYDEEGARFCSSEWSPNSRFLYMMEYDSLYQLDLGQNL